MLTAEEVSDVTGKFQERVSWYQENVPPVKNRQQLWGNELGVPFDILLNVGEAVCDAYIDVPAEIVNMVSPSTMSAIHAAMAIGIMLGKRISELSRVEENSEL